MANIPADIIIYALIAAGLIFWLRSILGTRSGDGPQRQNPFMTGDDKKQGAAPSKDIPMASELIEMNINQDAGYNPFEDEKIASSALVRDTLKKIAQKDSSFSPVQFLQNAEDAFIAIVEAFAEGDRDFLKPLLSDTVFQSFEQEIERRKAKGETVQTDIQAIRQAEITAAQIDGKMAYISVTIKAEETCVIRDEEQNIISGNPNRATEMQDIWVFGRALKSKDPIWRLYETHDGEPEDHKTPIPETE